ncbi:transposase [Acinetobacter gyllenbergii]|nr:transposase [Acinetobacter gyllenbergii]
MKTPKFTDSQIMPVLIQTKYESDTCRYLCREHGISNATFYKWRAKYGGMATSLMTRLKELEFENTKPKKMHVEERLKSVNNMIHRVVL